MCTTPSVLTLYTSCEFRETDVVRKMDLTERGSKGRTV